MSERCDASKNRMPFLVLKLEERTMSQGMWGAPRNWKSQGMDFPLEPEERKRK